LQKGDEGALDLYVSSTLLSLIDNVHQSLPLRRAPSPVLQGRYPPNGLIET
jgi:hypothetical protein